MDRPWKGMPDVQDRDHPRPGARRTPACEETGKMRRVVDRDETAVARAVYEATAADYVRLVGTSISAATESAGDRRLLLDLVRGAREGPVADLGSGPGRVAAMCQLEGRRS